MKDQKNGSSQKNTQGKKEREGKQRARSGGDEPQSRVPCIPYCKIRSPATWRGEWGLRSPIGRQTEDTAGRFAVLPVTAGAEKTVTDHRLSMMQQTERGGHC